MRNFRAIFFCLAIAILLLPSHSHALFEGKYAEVSEVFLRPKASLYNRILGGKNSAELYMKIYIEEPDNLAAARSPLAEAATIVNRADVGKPLFDEHEVAYWDLQPFKDTEFGFLGPFILLEGIKEMPKEGEKFPVTLVFKNAGTLDIMAEVVHPKKFVKSTQ